MATRVPIDLLHLENVPPRLREHATKLKGLSVEGAPLEAQRVVAIVGTREPGLGVREGARYIAQRLARYGIVIVSGGAAGIDAAAHLAALDVGAATWAVLPHGADVKRRYPRDHERLFDRIAQRGGSLVYPFPPEQGVDKWTFLARNEVIVALADAVIVVQAGVKSGSLNASAYARRIGRPLWMVPPAPWFSSNIAGNDTGGAVLEIKRGARPLHWLGPLLEDLGLTPEAEDAGLPPRDDPEPGSDRPAQLALVTPRTDPTERAIVDALKGRRLHPDEIAQETCLPVETVSTALLTLGLESVVVGLFDGRYRLCR